MSKYCIALRTSDIQAQNDANNFKYLVEKEWNSRVNRAAVKRMQRVKRSKLPVIPLTDDLKKFTEFLVQNIKSLGTKLKDQRRPEDWVMLAKCVMSRLILFNKRRRSEVRELRVSEYLNRPNWKNAESGELDKALTSVDRLLASRYYSCQYFLLSILIGYRVKFTTRPRKSL